MAATKSSRTLSGQYRTVPERLFQNPLIRLNFFAGESCSECGCQATALVDRALGREVILGARQLGFDAVALDVGADTAQRDEVAELAHQPFAERIVGSIREAITAGYSAQMVLIGLGMWDAEGFKTTRQVGEWVEKAGREGPLPTGQHSVAELLEEIARENCANKSED